MSSIKSIISSIVGGLLFLLFFMIIHAGIVLACIIGIVSWIAAEFILSPSNKLSSLGDGISSDYFKKTINEGRNKLKEIKNLSKQVSNPSIKTKVEAICTIAERILSDVEKKPSDVKVVRRFFSIYLDSTVSILEKYIDIASQGFKNNEYNETLQKVENLLDAIRVDFDKKLVKLFASDVLDLDSSVEAMKNILETEDF